MKASGIQRTCQFLSLLFPLTGGPAFFPCKSQIYCNCFIKLLCATVVTPQFESGFVHKGVKLEDQENQLCSCIFHLLSGD